jgi:hypothetical protein
MARKIWTVEDVGTKLVDGVRSEFTLVEKEAIVAEWNAEEARKPSQKLEKIRDMRNAELAATDYFSLSDVTLSADMSNYRQALRDIPQNYTDEDAYDLLRATDETGELTHSVWVKPS